MHQGHILQHGFEGCRSLCPGPLAAVRQVVDRVLPPTAIGRRVKTRIELPDVGSEIICVRDQQMDFEVFIGADIAYHQLDTGYAGSEALIQCGDLADLSFAESAIHKTIEKFGRLDVLVNNAAWREITTMRDISIESWDKTIRISLTASAFLARWATPTW